MEIRLFVFGVLLCMLLLPKADFKTEQLKNPRVKEAYRLKQQEVTETLKRNGIDPRTSEIYIRIFKKEKILELWGRNKNENFVFLKDYKICSSSGNLGPKRMVGDNQTPEGFYYINGFNPNSNFYLSLGINYPNASDRILSKFKNPGGDIFIHGNCVTIGCIPITDDKIKELYIYAVEAKNNGQMEIPVHIFPARMDDNGFKALTEKFASEKSLILFWENLKIGFNYFEKARKLPSISVMKNGRYEFR